MTENTIIPRFIDERRFSDATEDLSVQIGMVTDECGNHYLTRVEREGRVLILPISAHDAVQCKKDFQKEGRSLDFLERWF